MNNKHRMVAEIEKRMALISNLKGDFARGSLDAYQGLLNYINELPEDGWNGAGSILPCYDMTGKVFPY